MTLPLSYAGVTAPDLAPELERHLALADTALDAAAASGSSTELLAHLDRAARHGVAGFGRSGALWAVHQDAEVRAAALEAQQRFEAWRAAALARPDVYAVLEAVDRSTLEPAAARMVEQWLAGARINGAHLDEAARARLGSLQARASELATHISEAFVADVPLLDATKDELAGLPEDVMATLPPGDVEGTLRVRVEYVIEDVFQTNVRSRAVRERFYRLLQDRAVDTSLEPMRELFRVRREIARLSGFDSWADLRTRLGAAGSVARAEGVLDELEQPAADAVEAFVGASEVVLADELGGTPLQQWDRRRAINALQRAVGADAHALEPYLTLEAVAQGMFRIVREVFGVRVEEREGGIGWHEDVRTLVLIDDATGEELGVCLWDPWARDGKMAGTVAFMQLLEAEPARPDGTIPPAVTMLVTMVPRPADESDPHISVYAAGVLFHEFGHVLDFTIGSRAGVPLDEGWWGADWAEGPSFFLEYWGRSSEILATYARDPGTGAPPPSAAVDALGTAQAIDDVTYLSKYVTLGRLDLAVHGPDEVDLDEAWRAAHARFPIPDAIGAFRPFAMSMVTGGYDAALYGVPFALAVRDELLSVMLREGLRSADAGRRYVDRVLRPGPFVPPSTRLASFLGRPFSARTLVDRLEVSVAAARRAASGGQSPE